MNSDRKRKGAFEDGPESPSQKKARSEGTAASTATATGGPSGNKVIDAQALIAQKKAEIQAKVAALKQQQQQKQQQPPVATRQPPTASTSKPSTSAPSQSADLLKKIADAKARIQSFNATKAAASKPGNPYLSQSEQQRDQQRAQSSSAIDPELAGRGGLNMAAHPLLAEASPAAPVAQTKKQRYTPMAPKFSSVSANQRLAAPAKPSKPAPSASQPPAADDQAESEEPSLEQTPYFDKGLASGGLGASSKSHMGRGAPRAALRFNQKGKYVKMGEAMRQEARMEELKKRIVESARKAGLESELEDQAKVVKRPAPPEVEWWDAPFLPGSSYDTYNDSWLTNSGAITIYIQHPIQIPAPQDRFQQELKPLFLTKKEMKKMRKQRRAAALQDKQDRQKLGLLPPDPPKVKLSNMMRVLTQEAISDPTKIEAQVRREMVARERNHLRANAERQLTEDQRKEKLEQKKAQDEAKGIKALCFKVRFLSDPSHKFKVYQNAIQNGLTGITIFSPKFALVLVEGGPKGIKAYRHLMLDRIKWTEEAAPRDNAPPSTSEAVTGALQQQQQEADSSDPMKALEEPVTLADNYCKLVWQGEHRERLFRNFRRVNAPADKLAKDQLGPRLEGLWDVCKAEVKEEFDI